MNELPKILIVEDDMIIAADISMQLVKMGYEIIGMCTRAEDAIRIVNENQPDIIIMDIILSGKMNGIEASSIILQNSQTPVIFLTSNHDDNTFQKALATKPYAFIAKPFQKAELERALKITFQRIAFEKEKNLEIDETTDNGDHISTMEDRLFIRHKGEMVKVFIHDILYIEAERNYCRVTTDEKEFFLSTPMSKFEMNLSVDRFIKTHRSFIVNLSKIDAVSEYSEYLTIGIKKIPISRRLKEEVISKLKLV